jgi:uncharacterized protein YdaU (DUF1376 family)
VHYYQFNIADFRKDADWLTVEESGIYRWLIDQYYLDERPVCLDKRKIMRRLRLTSDQAQALDCVLEEFFIETPEGYKHLRVERDLASLYAKSDKARESANRRWHPNTNAPEKDATAMRSHSEGNTEAMLPNTQYPIPNTQTDEAAAAAMPKQEACPYQKVIDLYHKILPQHPRVKIITDKRKSHIKARWRNGANGLPFWTDYFETVAKSKFLTGKVIPQQGRKVFIADIDFLIREDVLVKTQEGKYHE